MVKLNHKIRLHAHFESREEVTFLTRKKRGVSQTFKPYPVPVQKPFQRL